MLFGLLSGAIHFGFAGLRRNWPKRPKDGDLGAIRELADRLDGKTPQAHTSEDGGDLVVVIRTIADITTPHGESCDADRVGPDQFTVKRLAAK